MKGCGCIVDNEGTIVDECIAHHTLRHNLLDAKNQIRRLEQRVRDILFPRDITT